MNSVDDLVTQLNYNFKPGDFIQPVVTTPGARGVLGMVLSVDDEKYTCYVMWPLPNGGVHFTKVANFNLQHA